MKYLASDYTGKLHKEIIRNIQGNSGMPVKITRGFTIIETMIVVMITAVVVGIALPSFSRFVEDLRIAQSAGELRQSIRLAQVEANRRNKAVRICPSVDGVNCVDDDGDDKNNWALGWRIYVAADDLTLFYQNRMKGVRIFKSGSAATIKISPGFRGSSLRITICSIRNRVAGVKLVLLWYGRVRSELLTDDSCD